MKINFFVAAICLIAAVLLGYLTYSIAHGDECDVLCGITSGLCFFSALVPMLAIKSYDSKNQNKFECCLLLVFLLFFSNKYLFCIIRRGYTILHHLEWVAFVGDGFNHIQDNNSEKNITFKTFSYGFSRNNRN